jgi:hypothetical protein
MWLPSAVVPSAGDAWTRHLVARIGGSLVAAGVLLAGQDQLAALASWTHAGCVVRAVTGGPCPGCGVTTSLLALAAFDAGAALRANPAGLAVAGMLVGQPVVALAALRRGAAVGAGWRWLQAMDWVVVGALLAVWVGRLAGVLR